MYQRKLEKDIRCPLEYGMELFGGKWNSRIICVLAALGTLRYSELRREMGNITDAVLASTLKGLIANGIVERKSYDEIPPRVVFPDGKGRVCGSNFAEHLSVGGCILQGRGRHAHDSMPEM